MNETQATSITYSELDEKFAELGKEKEAIIIRTIRLSFIGEDDEERKVLRDKEVDPDTLDIIISSINSCLKTAYLKEEISSCRNLLKFLEIYSPKTN